MSTTTTAPNGRPRKQLSDQLDRLDGIIDCLADGLNKAVSDAAREGSRAAVKEILTELLTNPEILTMIRTAAGTMIPAAQAVSAEPKVSAPPTVASEVIEAAPSAIQQLTQGIKSAAVTVVGGVYRTVRFAKISGRMVRRSPHLQKALVIGLGIGLATAVVASTPYTLAAAVSGVGAAATATVIQVRSWWRATRKRIGLI